MNDRDPLDLAAEALRDVAQDPADGGLSTGRAIERALKAPRPVWKTVASWSGGALGVGALTGYLVLSSTPAPVEAPEAREESPKPSQPSEASPPPEAAQSPESSPPEELPQTGDAQTGDAADGSPTLETGESTSAPPASDEAGDSSTRPRGRARQDQQRPRRNRPSARPTQRSSTEPPPEAPAVAPRMDDETARRRFREIHRMQFTEPLERVLAAWNGYLADGPDARFRLDARYHRAVILTRLGRTSEARKALTPFARGDHGPRRQQAAARLLQGLEAPP